MIDRSLAHDDANAVRFDHPFLPLKPLPQQTICLFVDQNASYRTDLPKCAYFVVQNGGPNTIAFSVDSIEDSSVLVAGDTFHGGYALGHGAASLPIYAGNVRSLDFRAFGGDAFVTVCVYGVN